MPLSDAEIERYNRQIIVPGIGAAGQEALLRTRALVVGDPRGVREAELYLRAAGLQVSLHADGPFDLAVVTDSDAIDAAMLRLLLASDRPVFWCRFDERGVASGEGAPSPARAGPFPSVLDFLRCAAACEAAARACSFVLGLR